MHAEHVRAHLKSRLERLLDDVVVVVVVGVALHVVIVVQSVEVTVVTALLEFPEDNVERDIISVQRGTAVLLVQDELWLLDAVVVVEIQREFNQ